MPPASYFTFLKRKIYFASDLLLFNLSTHLRLSIPTCLWEFIFFTILRICVHHIGKIKTLLIIHVILYKVRNFYKRFLFQRFQNITLYCIPLSSVYLYYIFHINSIHVKQNRAPTLSIPFLDYSSQPSAPYPPQQRAQKAKKLTQKVLTNKRSWSGLPSFSYFFLFLF